MRPIHAPCKVEPRRPGLGCRARNYAIAGLVVVVLGIALRSTADDWPQFLGPRRDGSSREVVATAWSNDGPKVLWSRSVGAGFAGPVAVGSRVLLHQRRGEDEVLECFDARRGGEPLWSAARPTTYRDDFGFDDGPRATPAVADGKVFTFGADGTLSAFELATGKPIWSAPLARDLGAGKGFFGFACSPLVVDGRVLLNLGAPQGAGIVAVGAEDGRVLWKSTSHEAGYSAPVLATLDGVPQAVFFTRAGLAVVHPRDGTLVLEHAWRSRMHASVNAATPLVLEPNRVFLTASYGAGAILLDVGNRKPRVVWSNDDSLSSHYASVVHRQGYLYGFHGRQENGPELRCIEAATGKVRWSRDRLGAGSLLLAGDHLLILTERGELIVAAASERGFESRARAQVLGANTRAFPALSNGLWLGRDTRQLVCLQLGPVAGQTP